MFLNKDAGQQTSPATISDAQSQAGQQQYEIPLPPPLTEIPEKMDAPSPEAESDEKIRSLQDILDKQQTALSAVTGTINAHHRQFEQVNSKINTLIAEISSLKQTIERLQNSPVTPPLKTRQAEAGQTQFKQESSPEMSPRQQSSSGHARTGNFKSDDVSIEKFFYYGGK